MASRPETQQGDTAENGAASSADAIDSSVPPSGGTVPSSKGIDPFVGRVLAHYRLEERLDAGGMGVLYRATDLKLGRSVAVKLLARHLVSDETAKARFVREAQTASALDHPNIGTVYDICEQDGELFIVMALYEGETLKQRLGRGRLSIDETLGILRQVALGLEAAHGAGIVHRDVKPANVFVARKGTVKILDFGLAKLASDSQGQRMTDTGHAMGTVLYMSPEQLRGETVDARSDLWSLGVLAHEVLSGGAPFQADYGPATAMRILNDEPLPLTSVPGVPGWLAELIAQLLRKEPGERPQTASEVLRRFDGAIAAPKRRWSLQQWFSELKRRRVLRVLVGYGVVAFVVLQIAQPLIGALHLADATLTYVVLALALGFPVAVVLAWAFDVSPEGVRRYARVTPGRSVLRGAGAALVLVGIGLAAAAPGLGWYFLLHGGARTASPRDGERRGAEERSSVAVLPFVNMSSEKENEYFSDGITEELINALANIEGLRVASRTSAFALKGKDIDVRQIGEKLNVGTVVEGSVRRDGDRLRIAAQLVNVADGYHLWSKTYERELKNIFAVEDELARSIVQALKPKLVQGDAAPLAKQATSSLEAHDFYLQGRYFKEKRTAEALRQAAGFFAQATEKDPQYALAWAGLADATLLLYEYDVGPGSSVLPKARRSALRALELDPTLAEAHATLGLIAQYSFQWAEAQEALRKAIELNPKYPTGHHWYALLLGMQGRIPEAYTETDRAYRLDPASPILSNLVGGTRLWARDFDGAVEAFKRTLETAPEFSVCHSMLGVAYAAQGKYTEALAEYDKGVPSYAEWHRGPTYVLAGRRSDAQRIVEEMEQRAKHEYVSPAARGMTWVALGDKDRGYALLTKACAENDWRLREAKVNPLFDSLRQEPRFHEILKCIHLE